MVSIIIPVYNSEKFLEKCLTSVQKQTYTDIEVLCIDDESTDMSGDIIRKFALSDNRFVYIKKKHSNAGEARNVGIAVAKGDYLLFLDSDDFFDANLVFNVVEHAIKTNADITVFQYKLYYDCQGKLSAKTYGIHTNRRTPFNLFELGTERFDFTNIAVWNKLYKTDFIHKKNLTFKSHSAINDVFFSWSALICAEKIALCRYVGTYYRINSGKSVSDNLIRTSECFLKAFHEINDFVKTSGMWDALREDIISTEKKQAEEFLARLKRDSKLYKVEDRFKIEMEEFFS